MKKVLILIKKHNLQFLIIILIQVLFFDTNVYAKNNIKTGIFGLWAVDNLEKELKILKNAGFDIVLGISNKQYLDKAHAIGLKVIVDFGMKKEDVRNDKNWEKYLNGLRNKVSELKYHPAVYAWYIVDEPDWQGIPVQKIEEATNLVRSLDPQRPLFTVLTIPKKWTDYLRYFDIISIDPYLKILPDGTLENPEKVKIYIQVLKNDLHNLNLKRKIWVVLGAFELRPKNFKIKSPFKKISPEEFREMIDIALSEKVEGILVWTLAFKNNEQYSDWYLPIDDPQLWDEVRKLPIRVKKKYQKNE